ncbi:MAG: hypothetical protein U1E78_06585 [Gammaproteobacteria bacterium]
MRTLSTLETQVVNGGTWPTPSRNVLIAMGLSGLLGGTITASISSVLSPLTTAVGTFASAAGGWMACKPHYPLEYTAACGGLAGLSGYLLSAAFVHTAIVVTGFGLGASGTYYYAFKNGLLNL